MIELTRNASAEINQKRNLNSVQVIYINIKNNFKDFLEKVSYYSLIT